MDKEKFQNNIIIRNEGSKIQHGNEIGVTTKPN
jgi:hypothetical protein